MYQGDNFYNDTFVWYSFDRFCQKHTFLLTPSEKEILFPKEVVLSTEEIEKLFNEAHANIRRPLWVDFMAGVGIGATIIGSYSLIKSLFFSKTDPFEIQAYDRGPSTAPVHNVSIQRNSQSQEKLFDLVKEQHKKLIAYHKYVTTEPKKSDDEIKAYMVSIGLITQKEADSPVIVPSEPFSIQKAQTATKEEALEYFRNQHNKYHAYIVFILEKERTDEEKKDYLIKNGLLREQEVQAYENPIMHAKSTTVSIQDNVQEVTNLFRKSIFKIHRTVVDDDFFGGRSVNMICVAYNTFLAPHHFFRKCPQEFELTIEQEGKAPHVCVVLKENIKQCDNTDLCVVHIPDLPHGRNLIKHFATRDQLKMTKHFNASVITWDKRTNGPGLVYVGEAERWDVPLSVELDGNTLYYPQGYKYNWSSQNGDCGSLLMALDSTCSSKILGVHFGFDYTFNKALSVIISREYLQQWVDIVTPPVHKITAQEPIIRIESSEMPAALTINSLPCFEYLGKVNDAPSQPLSHKELHRSPLYDSVYPAEKDLSVLKMNDSRMHPQFRGEPDILTRGVKDFCCTSKPWPSIELNLAGEALYHEFNKFRCPIDIKVQTIDWALNGTWCDGVRIPCTEALNLNTSSGYGLSGKKLKHIASREILNGKTLVKHENYITNPQLEKMIDDQWNSWMDGKTHPTIWTHALKSEPIKMSKIVNGNTRTFCVAQTCLLINVRRLFGSFTAAMKNSCIKSFSCLGMDVHSADWSSMYDSLRKIGPKGLDLDFVKYDRTAVTWQLARKVVRAINQWYDDDDIYQRARLIAMEDMIHSYTLINTHLVRKLRGNPSGNPITTELNNCVNYLMLCTVYLLVAKKNQPAHYSLRSWKENIAMKTYGDDIIFTIHPSIENWFLPNRIEEVYKYYGVPVTPADKSEAGLVYKPLDQLTFLKCNFLPFDDPRFPWQAGLSKTSIRSMIQFYRLKPNNGTMKDAVMVNIYESLQKAYHWGKPYFEEHKNNIQNWLKKYSWEEVIITFEELDFQYRSKLDPPEG
nr:hypothetical protein [Hubei picorna-like virus 79]